MAEIVDHTIRKALDGQDLTLFEFEVDRIVGVRRNADDEVEYAVQWSPVTIRDEQADEYLVRSKIGGIPLLSFVGSYLPVDQDHIQIIWLLTWEPSTSFTRCMDAVLGFWQDMNKTSKYNPGATELPLMKPGSRWMMTERHQIPPLERTSTLLTTEHCASPSAQRSGLCQRRC